MSESHFTPERYSKEAQRRAINEGLEEYLATPKSGVERDPELIELFDVKRAEVPLTRNEVENEAAQFLERHFRNLVPVLLPGGENLDVSELISRFGLTNEHIGLLGESFFLRQNPETGTKSLYRTDEYYPDGVEVSSREINITDLLALVWAKESIRIDSRQDVKKNKMSISHRYLLRSKNRYLSENDYGMRSWDEQSNQMNEPDVQNITPFILAIKNQLRRVQENLGRYYERYSQSAADYYAVSSEAAFADRGADHRGALPGGEYLPWEEKSKIEQAAREDATKKAQQVMVEHLSLNERDRQLLFTGITIDKVIRQLHFKYETIARKYGFLSDDPLKDYSRFHQKETALEGLFRHPDESTRQGATIEYVQSEFYDKPIIFGVLDIDRTVKDVKKGVRDVLGHRAAKFDSETADIIDQYKCRRGLQSPYFFPADQLYDFIKTVGVERAKVILSSDDRENFRMLNGWKLFEKLGFKIETMEAEKLRRQLNESNKLQELGLWRYFEEREAGRIAAARSRLGKRADNKTWEESLGVRAGRDLFFEGKRMVWLAQEVFFKNPSRSKDRKFYHQGVDWERYDLSRFDVPQEKLNLYLRSQGKYIFSLLGEREPQSEFDRSENGGGIVTLSQIIQALEQDNDLRGAALAFDKQRYLRGIIEGHKGNDLAFALEDWPSELRAAIAEDEIVLYFENADEYIALDSYGLYRYAEWRASEEGREWSQVFAEKIESKGELDFRLCLAAQTAEIRGWYKDAFEYIGGNVIKNYLLRFNSTRGADAPYANWHDVLFWVPNIRLLDVGEGRSILNGIQTVDDNQEFITFLPRYNRDLDKFRQHGPIESIRELKKRVTAIESNVDLSDLPPGILEITSAPGFNLVALDALRRRPDFNDLIEGRLDQEQPFKPHRRVFAGRPLTDALREGLGSHKMKIPGTAKDPKGLFHDLRQLIKGRTIGEKTLQVTDLFQDVPLDLEEEIIRMLQEQKVDIGPTVEAQIHAKSDPEGWVCGNYTDCCMPFGDYKNDDYMFSPAAQYFTIKSNDRIVAQSVVFDGCDRRDGSDVVILDNIEIAKNYRHLSPLLARVYQAYWSEYTSKAVKVGTGYSDLIPPGATLESNHYVPKSHIEYSDATGEQIYDLPKLHGIESLDQIVTFANLTESDAGTVADLESEIYPGGMVQGRAHIEDVLRSQRELEVPGAASSFIARQGAEAAGYLLVLPEDSEINPGERVAHLHDMAILPRFQGKGLARKMMERVLDIATAYKIPIEAEARASTSYAMLMNKRVRRWFEGRGFVLTHNEKKDKYLGGEDFYFVRFEYRGDPVED